MIHVCLLLHNVPKLSPVPLKVPGSQRFSTKQQFQDHVPSFLDLEVVWPDPRIPSRHPDWGWSGRYKLYMSNNKLSEATADTVCWQPSDWFRTKYEKWYPCLKQLIWMNPCFEAWPVQLSTAAIFRYLQNMALHGTAAVHLKVLKFPTCALIKITLKQRFQSRHEATCFRFQHRDPGRAEWLLLQGPWPSLGKGLLLDP